MTPAGRRAGGRATVVPPLCRNATDGPVATVGLVAVGGETRVGAKGSAVAEHDPAKGSVGDRWGGRAGRAATPPEWRQGACRDDGSSVFGLSAIGWSAWGLGAEYGRRSVPLSPHPIGP